MRFLVPAPQREGGCRTRWKVGPVLRIQTLLCGETLTQLRSKVNCTEITSASVIILWLWLLIVRLVFGREISRVSWCIFLTVSVDHATQWTDQGPFSLNRAKTNILPHRARGAEESGRMVRPPTPSVDSTTTHSQFTGTYAYSLGIFCWDTLPLMSSVPAMVLGSCAYFRFWCMYARVSVVPVLLDDRCATMVRWAPDVLEGHRFHRHLGLCCGL